MMIALKRVPNLVPRSLLARTILVFVIALVASQMVSVLLFRHYSREPRIQLVAIGFMTQLRTIRTALEVLPVNQHQEFIKKLREEGGVRVIRPRNEDLLVPAANVPALSVLRDRLRDEFGPEADIFQRPRPNPALPPVLIVKIFVAEHEFWVVFPRNRIVETDYSWAWIGWGVFGALLALAGAVFLVSRVTKPLRELARAARELGQGQNPAPVAELGPIEVQSVASAFNQMRDDLSRVERERVTFLAGVSHDLRTPLARLRLGIEMLPADPATRRDLEQDIEDINSVISQFMDFARDENHEKPETIDLNLLAQSAAERASRMGAEITLELGEIPPVTLRPFAIHRVIANLLDNAIKHGMKHAAAPTTQTKSDITVRTQRAANQIILSVLDRGPGIPANETERLKQPFTRLDDARSGKSGAGLGLAIIDRITKLHGGTCQLLPRDGGGLEARVSLPVSVQPRA